MPDRTGSFAFFDCSLPAEPVQRVLDVCAEAGLDVADPFEEEVGTHRTATRDLYVSYESWSPQLTFYLLEGKGPDYPDVNFGLNQTIDPSGFDETDAYQDWLDTVFELVARLSVAVESGYVPFFYSSGSGAEIPSGRPIAENVTAPPRFGVYSPAILTNFGGLGTLFDEEPWYAAELTDGRVLAIESASPWSDAGWEPPTNAEYIDHVVEN